MNTLLEIIESLEELDDFFYNCYCMPGQCSHCIYQSKSKGHDCISIWIRGLKDDLESFDNKLSLIRGVKE